MNSVVHTTGYNLLFWSNKLIICRQFLGVLPCTDRESFISYVCTSSLSGVLK